MKSSYFSDKTLSRSLAAQRCCQRLANIAISWFNDLAAVVENEAGKLCLGLR